MTPRLVWVVAWVVLTVMWIGLVAYLAGGRDKPLCEPKDNVVVRLAQPKGATEVGVIYLDFAEARVTRDGLDVWLHRYGRCP